MAWKLEVEAAKKRMEGLVRHTPLEFSPYLSHMTTGARVYIKLESEQVTGSFKVRGAVNKLRILSERDPTIKDHKPITSSTGNHALACNYAKEKLGIPITTYVPKNISPAKDASLKAVGADLVYYGMDCVDGEVEARRVAQEKKVTYISPYNDLEVVAGQGTIGLEILSDLSDVNAVLVPVGGGGLIGGIAAYIKAVKPSVTIIGCQPEQSKVMYESIKAGKIVFEESRETLSDGTAGGIEENAVTFELCRDYVDEWVLVTEEEIGKAVFFMAQQHHKIVEGAAGLSLGAFMKNPDRFKGQNVAIVACGANIGIDKLTQILNKYQ